jgi:hypothetical protein
MSEQPHRNFTSEELRTALSAGESVADFAARTGASKKAVYKRMTLLNLLAPKHRKVAEPEQGHELPALAVQGHRIDIDAVVALLNVGASGTEICRKLDIKRGTLLKFLTVNCLPRPLTIAARTCTRRKAALPEHKAGSIEATGGGYAKLHQFAVNAGIEFRHALKLWHATGLPTVPTKTQPADVRPYHRAESRGRAA